MVTPTTLGNKINLESYSIFFPRKLQIKEISHNQKFNEESLMSNKATKTFITKNVGLLIS